GSFMSSWFGRLILLGYTWALMHHMLGGIRHLIWDTGHGFGPQEREWLAAASLIGSISLTIVIWIIGYLFIGGPRRWRAGKKGSPPGAGGGAAQRKPATRHSCPPAPPPSPQLP